MLTMIESLRKSPPYNDYTMQGGKIKAETGQQSPRQCPDGNRHSDDGKPKDIVQRYRGKHGSGRTCYKVRGWSTGFS